MLSYRHGFHAGNFADVLKHSLLTLAIQSLKQKPKPFVYIDTHAGAGKYRLDSEQSQKTAEFEDGIGRLWQRDDAPEAIKDYLALIRAENIGKTLSRYPGSPALVRRLIRTCDRMQLSELHSTDHGLLDQLFARDTQVTVAKEDGLLSLEKKLPPIQRRGLILIDPSYEIKSEYHTLVPVIEKAHRRFATGTLALWYPVIQRSLTEKMLDQLKATGIPKQLRIEFCPHEDSTMRGMTGSGMLFINPPWQLAEQAEQLLPWLQQHLSGPKGHWQVIWQVPETPQA